MHMLAPKSRDIFISMYIPIYVRIRIPIRSIDHRNHEFHVDIVYVYVHMDVDLLVYIKSSPTFGMVKQRKGACSNWKAPG